MLMFWGQQVFRANEKTQIRMQWRLIKLGSSMIVWPQISMMENKEYTELGKQKTSDFISLSL